MDTRFKIGERVLVSPQITDSSEWIEGLIIKIRKNPFLGIEIAIKDSKGQIYFGEEKYFKVA